MSGIDVGGKIIYLDQMQADLNAGGVPTPNGISIAGPHQDDVSPPPLNAPPLWPAGSLLFTYDNQGNPIDLPPEAQAIVDAYTPVTTLSWRERTTTALEAAQTVKDLENVLIDAFNAADAPR